MNSAANIINKESGKKKNPIRNNTEKYWSPQRNSRIYLQKITNKSKFLAEHEQALQLKWSRKYQNSSENCYLGIWIWEVGVCING